MKDPPPYPATASPTASPLRSGNHFDNTGIGVAYPNPLPIPSTTPIVRYREGRSFAFVARTHPRLNRTDPATEIQNGPFLSCSRPAAMKLSPKDEDRDREDPGRLRPRPPELLLQRKHEDAPRVESPQRQVHQQGPGDPPPPVHHFFPFAKRRFHRLTS